MQIPNCENFVYVNARHLQKTQMEIKGNMKKPKMLFFNIAELLSHSIIPYNTSGEGMV